jgi:hypothetical protein
MTIISHRHKFIFLKTRKTAGTSIQAWLLGHLGPRDVIVTDRDLVPLPRPFFSTPSQTTRWREREIWIKKRLSRFGLRHMRLAPHSDARLVRKVVGKKIWQQYHKFAVVRDPWDRMISAWRFRQYLTGTHFSLDDMIDARENNRPEIKDRGNWLIYTIDDEIVADTIIRYEQLHEGLAAVAESLGLPPPALQRYKSGLREPTDTVSSLTDTQIARIERLNRNEIEAFGYEPPRPMTTSADELFSATARVVMPDTNQPEAGLPWRPNAF